MQIAERLGLTLAEYRSLETGELHIMNDLYERIVELSGWPRCGRVSDLGAESSGHRQSGSSLGLVGRGTKEVRRPVHEDLVADREDGQGHRRWIGDDYGSR
ncbi:MAG: hypothetical protein ACXWZF_12055 [Actinomycetota bacterium]